MREHVLFGAGVASYARRDPTATALFVLPGAVGGATLIALGRNLWPRFFLVDVDILGTPQRSSPLQNATKSATNGNF